MATRRIIAGLLGLVVVVGVLLTGCAAQPAGGGGQTAPPDWGGGDGPTGGGPLEGSWEGTEVGGAAGRWTMTVDWPAIDMSGPQEWYVGTLQLKTATFPKQAQLTIEDCGGGTGPCEVVGLTALGIYELAGDTMIWASHGPGNPTAPTSFELDGATRVFEFTRVVDTAGSLLDVFVAEGLTRGQREPNAPVPE